MDARVRFTKHVIRESFLEILEDVPLSRVTVKEICARADINRATFYKYYDNPYDLMDKIEKDVLDQLQEKLLAFAPKGVRSLPDIFRVILLDMKENFEIYRIMFSENGDKKFYNQIFEFLYQDNLEVIQAFFPKLDPKKQEMLYYFIAEGCGGVVDRWFKGEIDQSVDDMIEFAITIIDTMNRSLPKNLR